MNNKSRGIKALLANIAEESRAVGMMEALEGVATYVKDGLRWDDFSTKDFDRHLVTEITKVKRKVEESRKGTLAARITIEIEQAAAERGAIDPGLVAAYIERENTVRAGAVATDGTVSGISVESRDMMRGEGLEEHIRRLCIAPDTACLFRTEQPAQSNKKAVLKNPWKKESFNLTLQGKIITENPEMAERLKAESNVAGQ